MHFCVGCMDMGQKVTIMLTDIDIYCTGYGIILQKNKELKSRVHKQGLETSQRMVRRNGIKDTRFDQNGGLSDNHRVRG